jgi:Flp pilus assembly protein TadG
MSLKNQNGGSLIEFVIIAPVLFVILFGIIEFGILIYDKAMLTNASREGARAGIVYSFPDRISDAAIRTAVRNYCEDHLISFDAASVLTIPITRSGSGNAAGDTLTVTANYPFRFLVFSNVLALIGGGADDLVNLSAVTVMRLE